MPLIKPRTHRVRYVRNACRVPEPTRDALVLYARFIGDTADCGLSEASRRAAFLESFNIDEAPYPCRWEGV